MSDKEMLKEVIELAIERGFEPLEVDTVVTDCFRLGGWHLNQILFDKSFAKAFWGEGHYNLVTSDGRKAFGSVEVLEGVTGAPVLEAWQYHLQQCVISESPIKYYWDNRGEK